MVSYPSMVWICRAGLHLQHAIQRLFDGFFPNPTLRASQAAADAGEREG